MTGQNEPRGELALSAADTARHIVNAWLARGYNFAEGESSSDVIKRVARCLVKVADSDAILMVNICDVESRGDGTGHLKYSFLGPLATIMVVKMISALRGAAINLTGMAREVCPTELAAFVASIAPESSLVSRIMLQEDKKVDEGTN